MLPWAGVKLRRLREGKGTPILLVLILLVAAALRWNGLDWDQGHVFHPDERYILMVTAGLTLPLPINWSLLLSPNSPLNPHSFAYGSLPFYLLKLITQIMSSLGTISPALAPLRAFSDFDHLRIVGRFLSGLFDLGSIALIYLIGRKLLDWRVGLLAAAFLSVTVINIQYSHFYASDTLLTFFVVATVLFSVEALRTGSGKATVLAGIMIGLAVGSKFSAMPLLAVLGSAHLLRLFRDESSRGLRLRVPDPAELNRSILSILSGFLVAAIVFLIVEPYALIDFATFAKNIAEQNDMARGIADLPYTRQYANTPPYWYFIYNLVIWGMGLPLGLTVVVGATGAIARALRRPRAIELLLLSWVLPYFAITGSFHAKFLRYLLPLTPFLCLFAAYALFQLRDWCRSQRQIGTGRLAIMAGAAPQGEEQTTTPFSSDGLSQGDDVPALWPEHLEQRSPEVANGEETSAEERAEPAVERAEYEKRPSPLRRWIERGWGERAVSVAIAVALVGGLLYSLAFSNIYTTKHTAVRASEWIYQNVPPNSRIMTEHWEEGLPVPLSVNGSPYDTGRMGYKMLTFAGYDPDNPAKLAQIIQQLRETDYIVFFSNRLYDTIPRLPQRYPITSKYYQLLFGEKLGFRLEAFFTSYPSILGVTLVEDTFGDPHLPIPAALANFRPTPLTIVAGKADESFSVYDHPKVLIFKKDQNLSEAQLRALFASVADKVGQEPGGPAVVSPPSSQPKSLLLSAAQRATVAAGGTFRDLFNPSGLENRLPVPVWVVLVELLGLLGLPLAFTVFRNLPDRGYLLAKPLGILVLAWLDWMLVSLGLLHNTRLTALLALLVLALASGYFAHRQRSSLRAFWREQRRLILTWEAVFWVAFALFLIIRLANPDLWHPARGGEKPMDLAFLMAAIKSATFPPYDPWFAGGYMNYYYYGQIIVATLIKISGIVPTMAYNLAVPLLFALTAGGAFSAAYNLLAPGNGSRRLRSAALMGGLGSAFAAVIFGNLGGAIQLFDQIAHLAPAPLQSQLPGVGGISAFLAGLWQLFVEHRALSIPTDWYWPSTRVLEGTINEFPFFTFLYADLHAHMIALPFTMLALGLIINLVKGYAARAGGNRPPALISGQPGPAIDSELLALSGSPEASPLPYENRSASSGEERSGRVFPSEVPEDGQLARTVRAQPAERPILGVDRSAEAWDARAASECSVEEQIEEQAPRTALPVATMEKAPAPRGLAASLSIDLLLQVLITGLAIGALMPINSWDFPTYLLLFAVTMLLGWYLARPISLLGLGKVVLKTLGLVVLSYALYWPFHSNFQQWYTGIDQIKDKSDVWGYLRIHGFFLFAITSFLITETGRRYGRTGLLRGAAMWARHWDQLPRVITLQQRLVKQDGSVFFVGYGIALLLAFMLLLHLMGMTLVALLFGLLVWTALLMLHGDNPPERAFVLMLIATGLILSIAVEFIAIKGDIGRMNTVFKFYLQVWMLWSIAGVVGLYYALQQIRAHWSPRYREVWGAMLALLVVAAMVYPLVATRARVSDRYDTTVPLTLDGTAYMANATFQEQNPDTKQTRQIRLGTDLPAIHWLQDNVVGTPVILEGWAPIYHWGARYSIYTGLPTVIGWDWHEKQQRWGYQAEIDQRVADVRTIYNDPNVEHALTLLDKYDVQYIIVGDLERAVYSQAGLAKFDQMVGRYLKLVYDNQGVRIYRRL